MGMCFGVRDALDRAASVEDPRAVTIHGELVHNGAVLQSLAQRGFRSSSEGNRGGPTPTPGVLITAHGVSQTERDRLLQQGKQLIDTTCPLVRHVQDSARELEAEGRLVLVIGRPGHVEVKGIVGDLSRFEVLSDVAEVRCFGAERLGVVSQSTTPPERFERLLAAIRLRNGGTDIRVIDTICQPTRIRQLAAARLVEQVDAVVVVGGLGSNNTAELVRLCAARELPVSHVETAADVDPEWASQFEVIGLTAGTSTRDQEIDAVEALLLKLARMAVPRPGRSPHGLR